MRLRSTFVLAGLHLAAVSKASPIAANDGTCIEQTLFCYQSGETTTQNIINEAVEGLCKKYDGLDLGGRLQAAFDFYISRTGHHIGAEISRHGLVVADCDYNITYKTCKEWLPKAFDECPTHQGGNLTDDRCGLRWLIDPDVLGDQDMANATATKKDCGEAEATTPPCPTFKVISAEGFRNVSWAVPGNKSSLKRYPDMSYMGDWGDEGCYNSGYQRSTDDFMQAATAFCNQFNFQVWLSLQVQPGSEPLCMLFAQCMLMMMNFIETTCADEKHGGWALNDHGYLIIDGDPLQHDNEHQTAPDLDCTDDKAINALIAAHPPQRHHEYDDWTCPSH
ncbi:hypothetical protein PRZ48_002990 [Zasmidium cellare]|uniref:Uncharacterized protein n=1 Tax=Zasmidium cellare TaxID=395010 RepID=A0ABR0EU46_ZASCE|nr:hypothetical protein PRZ48_002990 [Zasmidium cellare]